MARSIQIGPYHVGGHFDRPRFIAEVGINYSSPDEAFQLSDACIAAGADIIKFQLHLPPMEMLPEHPWHIFMKNSLNPPALDRLKERIEDEGRMFLCTPFSRESADDLEYINVAAFKTGSGEANNIPLLKHIALKGRPMIISTGMTTRKELIASLDAVRKINPNIVLMNCTSNYPSTPEQTRLQRIEWLRSVFGLPVGQSDHSPTISTAVGAVALGACLVEKHVTLDKDAEGPDHKASLLPSEFKQMVDMSLEVWEGTRRCTEHDMTGLVEGEQELRDIANHSLVTIAPMKQGQEYTIDSLWCKRPGTGIPAAEFENVLGRRATRDLEADTMIGYNDVF